ncbi:hypothetical protein evm_001914 [Chilo suppressalis]|nr:hypothetical protein evm_001914 [Chilo suppressalis]
MSLYRIILVALTLQYDCFCELIPDKRHVADGFDEPMLVNKGLPPESYDWRKSNKVTPVKDQGACNICSVFSAVANIESQLVIHTGKQEILSEAFIMDCTANINCGQYTSILDVFSVIVTNYGGVLKDTDYFTYEARKSSCRWERSKHVLNNTLEMNSKDFYYLRRSHATPVSVIGFRRVKSNEDVMAEYIYKFGPLSAAINSKSMDTYTHGIDEPTIENCSPNELDHAVLIVGYSEYVSPDTGKITPYWIIKNSWGTGWGDSGYYYLVRGRNACGIAMDVSFAFVN